MIKIAKKSAVLTLLCHSINEKSNFEDNYDEMIYHFNPKFICVDTRIEIGVFLCSIGFVLDKPFGTDKCCD